MPGADSNLPWLQPEAQWNFPVAPSEPQHMSFAYPNTPLPTYIAPPNQQPMSDMNAPTGQNSLGFVQLDDWFGTGHETRDEEPFGALDLQDFWMKVGPGEVSIDMTTLIEGSRWIPLSLIHHFFGRSPNILVPTRTLLLPSLTA
jgi:hypothetical protein